MNAIITIEKELKKRLSYPYRWGRMQNTDWDKKTNFIYSTLHFSDFLEKTNGFSQELRDYAMNRWYNFWSAKAVEQIFAQHPNVITNKNPYDKLVDFEINHIPFDHKTSVYPKGIQQPILTMQKDKIQLIRWLYNHQSQESRKHLKNRLFIVLYDSKQYQHWKLKAELTLLKQAIDAYMSSFSVADLQILDFGQGRIYSDIIWLIK